MYPMLNKGNKPSNSGNNRHDNSRLNNNGSNLHVNLPKNSCKSNQEG
jgi:hypothetical protein